MHDDVLLPVVGHVQWKGFLKTERHVGQSPGTFNAEIALSCPPVISELDTDGNLDSQQASASFQETDNDERLDPLTL